MTYDPKELTDKLLHDWYVSYDDVLESFGHEVVLSDMLGSWQGDYVAILKSDDGWYGFLVFGYGSCSGCDAIENINDTRDTDDLASFAKGLYSSIRWFSTLTDLAKWLVRKVLNDDVEPGAWYHYDRDLQEWASGFSKGVLGEG